MSIAMFYAAAAANAAGGGGDPPGAPNGLHATNNGTNYFLVWSDASADDVEIFRDGESFDTVGAGEEGYEVGPMFGDGTHTWKVRHIDPTSDFGNEITTTDGIEGGGGGPSGAPSGLSVYEYQGGSKYGIQWSNGDSSAQTELEDSGQLLSAGTSSADQGVKAGSGAHTWKARHLKNGVYSSYSETISTFDGVES
jgi:hypothetical protein